jgi:hypothetical protein
MIKCLSFGKIPLFPRDLHGNNFTGNIPDLDALANLQQL